MVGEKEGVSFNKPSMTQQQFKDDCNINNIIDRYRTTGALPVSSETGFYGDFSAPELQDYANALSLVEKAESDFNALPSNIRERFGYSPANLLAFMADSKNYEEAVSLGLVIPQESQNNVVSDDVVVSGDNEPQPKE